jgi:hypothetical protein
MCSRLLPVTFAASLLAALACQTPADLVVKTGPGTPYPCGVNGKVCSGGTCCGENEVCGGDTPKSAGCPAGYCCDDAPFDPSPRYSLKGGDAGAPPEHHWRVREPQWVPEPAK